MKLLLLHGAAEAASRKKLAQIKEQFDPNNVVVFEEGTKPFDINNNLTASSLFSTDRLIILENPPEEEFTNYPLDPTSEGGASSPYTLVFWFDHEISDKKPILSWVKKLKGEILYFPEAKEISIFPFLDYLAIGNKKAFLELNKLKKAGFDIFYFITMVFYLLRSMVTIPKNVPQFVRSKLQKQRTRFNREILERLYKNILQIEFKIKSGLLETDQATFLLVNKFMV